MEFYSEINDRNCSAIVKPISRFHELFKFSTIKKDDTHILALKHHT